MKEQKHFTADEQCQAVEKNGEMGQTLRNGSLDASSKAIFSPSFALLP